MTARTSIPIELIYTAFGIEGGSASLSPTAAALSNPVPGAKAGLASRALAIGLWHLREAGALGLDLRKEKALGFISTTKLIVSPADGGARWPGIEGELLDKLREKGARDAGSLVAAWCGKGTGSAEHSALDRMRDRAIEAGLVHETVVDARRGLLGRALLGESKKAVTVDATSFASAAPELDELASGWIAFTQREPDVAKELVTRVQKAVERKEVDADVEIGGDRLSGLD